MSQIQKMWHIYHQASYVAAWLGTSADNSDELLENIAELGRRQSAAALQWGRQEKESVSESDLAVDSYPSPLQLRALVQRPYWQRLWIQQEIRASNEIWVHCGYKRIRADWLRFVLQLFMSMKSQLFYDMVTYEAIPEVGTLGAALLHVGDDQFGAAFLTLNTLPNRAPLISLLKHAFSLGNVLKCTDPRDRVYGLLGFASDASAHHISLDYSKTCLQVYLDTAVALIKKDISIMTLHNTCSEDRLVGLPSWAPDWSRPFATPLISIIREDISYKASGSTRANFDFLGLQDSSLALSATGCVFDLIVQPEAEEMLDESKGAHPLDHTLQRMGHFTSTANQSIFCQSQDSTDIDRDVLRAACEGVKDTEDGGLQLATDEDFESICMELDTLSHGTSESSTVRRAMGTMKSCLKGRRLFITMGGRFGLGPKDLAQRDVLAILFGLDIPLILRETEENVYRVIGNDFVGGVMHGELFKRRQKIQRLHIV